MQFIDRFFSVAAAWAWGWPLVVLLVGGGAILTLWSRFLPFIGARHAYDIVRGKFDDPADPGDISHFQALSTALSSTVGMGNIAGVAVAITQGGPGAVFWMWLAAIVGMTTKFFTCTLACMYRQTDETGQQQGGPMYYIEVGLGPRYRILAVFFAVCGLIGCLGIFQANQLAEVLDASHSVPRWATGLGSASLVALVVLGGITRIGRVAAWLTPMMCVVYVAACLFVLLQSWRQIPDIFLQILHDAFAGSAATGGAAGITVSHVITTGVKRAAFSNEAGIGTAPMAHGAAKTKEPVREGLVAMVGPFIDTIVVCSMTAFVILASGNCRPDGERDVQGVELTVRAFESAIGVPGKYLITTAVVLFAVSTMFGYAYYGRKCFAYLAGERRGRYYEYFYVAAIGVAAVWSLDTVINMLDTSFALMAIPNMIATLLLAPRVLQATRDYFSRSEIL